MTAGRISAASIKFTELTISFLHGISALGTDPQTKIPHLRCAAGGGTFCKVLAKMLENLLVHAAVIEGPVGTLR